MASFSEISPGLSSSLMDPYPWSSGQKARTSFTLACYVLPISAPALGLNGGGTGRGERATSVHTTIWELLLQSLICDKGFPPRGFRF